MLYALMVLLAQEEGKPAGAEPQNPLISLLPLILIIGVFYFLVILPARRREKAQRDTLFNSLKKNDKVLTSAGIIGTVGDIKDDEVTLKVDESSNVRLRVLKSSIVKIMSPKEPADANSEAVKAGAPPAKT
jgi:preprotein translocase subunit YajC